MNITIGIERDHREFVVIATTAPRSYDLHTIVIDTGLKVLVDDDHPARLVLIEAQHALPQRERYSSGLYRHEEFTDESFVSHANIVAVLWDRIFIEAKEETRAPERQARDHQPAAGGPSGGGQDGQDAGDQSQ